MKPVVSVVIVTWNGRQYLTPCFDALLPQLPRNSEIILVDNGSHDGTASWALAAYPQVRVLALAHNAGFAGGTNAGIRVARSDLILLINNDAFAEPGFVEALLVAAQRHPDAGAVAGVLTFAHRPEIVASAGLRARNDGLALDLWAGKQVCELPTEEQLIMGASGGAMLIRRAMLADIGLFEAWFFNYLEDVDLAWRGLLRGWKVVVAPAARARHVYSATGGQGSPFKQRLLARNRLAALVRCWPDAVLMRYLPRIAAYDALATAYGLMRGMPAIAAGRRDALRMWHLLLAQRRAIQAGRTAPTSELEGWLEPAPMPWKAAAEQRWLADILAERE
jgi:GT2 family glycosyltransferase